MKKTFITKLYFLYIISFFAIISCTENNFEDIQNQSYNPKSSLKNTSELIEEAIYIRTFLGEKSTTRGAVENFSIIPYESNQIKTRSDAEEKENPYMYIVNYGNDTGYAVIPAQRGINAILAYSETGTIHSETIDSVWFLNMFFSNMQRLFENGEFTSEQVKTRSNNNMVIKKQIRPLLTTHWHQNTPFNNKTPLIDGQHAIAGCYPVAVAQVMAFHHKPDQYDSYQYNWNNMISNIYDEGIAHLVSEIGYASKANWGLSSTSVTSSNLKKAFQAFGYQGTGIYQNYDFFELQRNINKNLPVIILGDDGNAGHAWVADGYIIGEYAGVVQSVYLTHCNVGWRFNWYSGYYYSGAFNFSTEGPIYSSTRSTESGNFNRNLKMLTEIAYYVGTSGPYSPNYEVFYPKYISIQDNLTRSFFYSSNNPSSFTYEWDIPIGLQHTYSSDKRNVNITFEREGTFHVRTRVVDGTFSSEWKDLIITVGDFCGSCINNPCTCRYDEIELHVFNSLSNEHYSGRRFTVKLENQYSNSRYSSFLVEASTLTQTLGDFYYENSLKFDPGLCTIQIWNSTSGILESYEARIESGGRMYVDIDAMGNIYTLFFDLNNGQEIYLKNSQ